VINASDLGYGARTGSRQPGDCHGGLGLETYYYDREQCRYAHFVDGGLTDNPGLHATVPSDHRLKVRLKVLTALAADTSFYRSIIL